MSGIWGRLCAAALVALASATAAIAGPAELEAFLKLHRCEVERQLAFLFDVSHPQGRYLILSWRAPDESYVQCEFEDDNSSALCEAASRFYLKPPQRIASSDGLLALARRGFALDGSQGNYSQILPLAGEASLPDIADLMLASLYEGYRGFVERGIKLKASDSPSDPNFQRCEPVS